MVDIVLGCDSNGHNDSEYQNTVATVLEQAGHTVEKLTIEPNAYAKYSYESKAQEKVGIYLIAAGTFSIGDGVQNLFQYNYFGIRPECSPNWDTTDFDTKPIGADADSRGGVNDNIAGHSFKEINEIVKDRCMCVTGKDATEMGDNLVSALNGQNFNTTPSNTNDMSGGSVVNIPDKTFYGLIKQIIGAIDGVFIIANNMAYLLSFKDLYKYRDLYEEYIPEITASDILIEGVTHDWTTEGLYNAVEVTYADGIFRYQHDVLIELYGENTFYYDFPNDDEETAKSKAKALLSAHIRDYSLDIYIDCLYNPNITVGSWVKIPKTLTNTSTTSKNGQIKKLYKAPERKLRKGVNITNINEISNQDKVTQHITTADGEEYDIDMEKKDYEIYFVQGYRMRWTPKQVPIMHLHLKYGPDTPEDPINATIGIGTVSTSTGTNASATYGDDCFGVEISQLYGDHRIPHSGKGGVEYATENPPSEQMTAGRCKQGSTYAQELAGKTPEEAFYIASSKFVYCCYADNCGKYKCNEERWTSGECGFNCGDCSTILKSCLDCVGMKNWIFHIDGHYHNMVENNGVIQSADLSRSLLSGTEKTYTHTVGWPSAQTTGGCHCPCYNC